MNYPDRPIVYQVAYVNWQGVWCMDTKQFKTESAAKNRSKLVAKQKAENGRVSVRKV